MVCSALRCQAWEFLSSLVLTWLHLDRSVCVYGCVRVCVCACVRGRASVWPRVQGIVPCLLLALYFFTTSP